MGAEQPTVQGWVHPHFAAVTEAMVANVAEHGEVGAAVSVSVGGDVVVDAWIGHADGARTRPWRADTLVDVYSVGKGIGAILVLELVDAGLVDLDEPVARYWPAFGAGGKASATVRHLLCHRAGVPAIREPLSNADLFDFDTMTAAVARTASWWTPGERHAYHTNTYGHLVGGLVRAVTGERPGARLARLAARLDADVHLGVPDIDLERCAELVWDAPAFTAPLRDDGTVDVAALGDLDTDEAMTTLSYINPPGYSSMGVVNTRQWRQAEILSTNLHATADGVRRIYQALLDGTVLSAEVLAEAARAQSQGWCPTLGQDVTFGLGFQPWTPKRPLGRSPGSFGHFGTGGSLGFADPSRGIAFGYVMNHVIPRWQSPRNRALVDAVYASC